MVREDREQIVYALSQLSTARQAELGDEGQRIYLNMLDDLDPGWVTKACASLAKTPRQAYATAMPSVPDIRREVDRLIAEETEASAAAAMLPGPRLDEQGPTFVCAVCWDTGWVEYWCEGGGKLFVAGKRLAPAREASYGRVSACGRRQGHHPHPYASRCACAPYNPVVRPPKRQPDAAA